MITEKEKLKQYPVAEYFHSVQGEGVYTGQPMFFVRLAGCNVGEFTPIALEQPLELDHRSLRVLRRNNLTHSVCTNWAGKKFLCDTDYRGKLTWTVEDIAKECNHEYFHICLTGGEPYLHDLMPIGIMCRQMQRRLHIETSGTLPIVKPLGGGKLWITCSPKAEFLEENRHLVDEWKFVIDEETSITDIEMFLHRGDPRPVYLQPVNDVDEARRSNVERVLTMVHQRPTWRVSAQLHKYLRVR